MPIDNPNTPAFLAWAIEYSCPIREFQNGADPERTERQLRAAVMTSAARREGRVFEGYCVDPPLGFRLDEALAIYSGLENVEHTCGDCPANALSHTLPGALAGCVGMLALPLDGSEFCNRVDQAIDELGLAAEYLRLFTATQPRWNGFWISSPLTFDQTSFLTSLAEAMKVDSTFEESLLNLHAGLCVARDNKLPFHANLYPRGCVESNWWKLVPHCPRCTADWTSTGGGNCSVCGYEGHPAPNKKRRARGRRPYLPLERLMGNEAAAQFLLRYEAWKQSGK